MLERICRDYQDPAVQRAVLRLYRATDATAGAADLHRRLRGLDRPALVVWGERDPYLPVRYAEQQRETYPHAEVVVLTDSGHWPMIDHPTAIEAPVLRFLRAVTGDPALPLSYRGARCSAAGEAKLAAIPVVEQDDGKPGAQGNRAH